MAYVEQGYLLKSEKCLADVAELAPHETYIQQHLQIVRARIQQAKEVSNFFSTFHCCSLLDSEGSHFIFVLLYTGSRLQRVRL